MGAPKGFRPVNGFKPGKSGNPGGRPHVPEEVKEAARALSLEAIERLAFWMRSDNPKASVAATQALLDRAWGKAAQTIAGDKENPLTVIIQGTDAGLL